jgi:hypothetical protein
MPIEDEKQWVKYTIDAFSDTATSSELRTMGLLEAVMDKYVNGKYPNDPDAHTMWRMAEWFKARYGRKD